MAELLLDRYQKLKTLLITDMKSIQLYNNRNTGQKIVAKVQSSMLLKDSKVRNVLHEASFTQSLQGYRGIPFMIWSGKTRDEKIVLLLQQLGDSLKDRLLICDGRFSLKTVCMLGIQMIQIVKTVHDKGFIVSNVSIQLFQFGKGQKSLNLYINDLGDCLTYRDNKTMAHILTPRPYFRSPANMFESGSVYKNIEKSRKDDIQSIFLILIYLLKGELPWSLTFTKQKIYKPVSKQFLEQFENTKKICDGCPKVFSDILEDCRSLKFQQQPPYHWYILKLKSLLYFSDETYDFVFDWMLNPKFMQQQALKLRNPNIILDKDNQFMQYLERQIFPHIDADQINTKFQYYHTDDRQVRERRIQNIKISQMIEEKREWGLGQQDVHENDRNIGTAQISGKNKNIKKQQEKGQIMKNNILQRKKKNKDQCCVM